MEETKKAEQLDPSKCLKCKFCSFEVPYSRGEKGLAENDLKTHIEEDHKQELEAIEKWAKGTTF